MSHIFFFNGENALEARSIFATEWRKSFIQSAWTCEEINDWYPSGLLLHFWITKTKLKEQDINELLSW